MKHIILVCILLPLFLTAEGQMHQTVPRFPEISLPIERPVRPIRPIPIVVHPGVVYQDNYYNTNIVSNCQQYVDQIAALQSEIAALKSKVALLENKAAQKLQKELKSSYEAELKKFENRKSSVKSTNSVIISDKPQ